MNIKSFFGGPCHSPIRFVALVALASSSLAFGGEIHNAAALGDLGKVKALLKDNPALVFSRDTIGDTPLHLAVFKGHKDVAEMLLAHKAEVNAKSNNGGTPLRFAADRGYKDVAELLAGKADVNARDKDGLTPLHYAAAHGYQEVTKLLRQHGGY